MLRDTEQERLKTYQIWDTGTIGKCIGNGSFGKVYELYGIQTGGKIDALKVITIEYTPEAQKAGKDKNTFLLDGLQNALSEIRQMMEFRDLTNFVSIYDYETYPIRKDGQLEGYDILIRMERLTALPKYIEQKKPPLTEKDFIQIGMDVCTALIEANELVSKREKGNAQFFHRDIKPDNIFVSEDGIFKLGDLGIAAMQSDIQYTKIGTPQYMAPEMFSGDGYHANVDLYALGRTLEKLTEGMVLISGLDRVILRAKELYPDKRYQTPQEMRRKLQECLYRLEHGIKCPEEDDAEQTIPAHELEQQTIPAGDREQQTRPVSASELQKAPPTDTTQFHRKKKSSIWTKLIASVLLLAAAGAALYFGGQYYQAKQWEKQIEAVRIETERCMQADEYEDALRYLYEHQDIVIADSRLSDLQKQCEDSYRAFIIRQAKELYDADDMERLYALLEKGLQVLENDIELKELKEKYDHAKPVSLYDVAVTKTNQTIRTLYAEDVTDADGTEYEKAFRLFVTGSNLSTMRDGNGYLTFATDNNYASLQLDYFPERENAYPVCLKIVTDGVVVYSSEDMKAEQTVQHLSVDLTGVDSMTIQCTADNKPLFSKNASVMLVNASLKKRIDD